ncbi:M20 family metallopeptidase [bacterium]|jgi:acetylornithine deacetylase|nr:M20 family metallopeptidase [Planctomicrobium sp.]MDB4802386.1 M20 family metallopeptidase [bacterium]
MPTALEYTQSMVEFDSVSSKSNVDVTNQIQDWLRELNCEIERVDYVDNKGVPKSNVIAKIGSGLGGLAYFGHSDVVPANTWVFQEHGPFEPTIRDGKLYGRGTTDMKGSVACFLAAMQTIQNKKLAAPVYFCCTADEEVGMQGAERVVKESKLYREMVEGQSRAIIGEPTMLDVVHGHKGGCSIRVTSKGRAAHSSSKEGTNANWKMIPFLAEMKALNDELESDPNWRNEDFIPPTMTMNLGINDHTPAINITPPQSICTVYYRQMPKIDADPVFNRILKAAEANGLEAVVNFKANPFYVEPDSPFIQECLELAENKQPRTVAYGTDGAWYYELKQAVVMGPGSIDQAHTHDEWLELTEFDRGTDIYSRMIDRWCV